MKRDTVLKILATRQEHLQTMGVKSLDLFGSVARDEASDRSDVDLLVEFDRPMSLFDFSRVKFYLEDILGCSVDMGTRKDLRQKLRDRVIEESIRAF
ncbi:MAG: nucleotidyltransferase family protein [Cyanobacteria bacterium P01_E01_bin.42]